VVLIDTPKLVEALFETTAIERNGVVSPDAHWLAYESDSEGPPQIYVVPIRT
jgi:Tol biopolymer transport system component